jgi:mannose/fructose/N-acetylgalactosamine-specific phosphotransferase system component IID
MTEGILIGGLVILGGLVASYMKTHPFYSHKTQKYKENYQRKLQDILSHT